ncbi:VapB-type antitoxin [Sulfolobus sp. S-194]|uniref:type II toxin-antitoxin system VapB family antitoxin n=1 Tax=Sulfolobus sp. S-194 TaxID=2512240 RepID=UPI0014371A24|nr:VapB-type antitoxin [Sulfolobus sp. S-194]QIW23744.1 VapB-type antitoxin [Sulfolobus sp. S-194]
MRLPKELKEKMEKYEVNWDQLIKDFVEKKVEELERENHAKRAKELLSSIDLSTNGFGLKEVRRHREGN